MMIKTRREVGASEIGKKVVLCIDYIQILMMVKI